MDKQEEEWEPEGDLPALPPPGVHPPCRLLCKQAKHRPVALLPLLCLSRTLGR